MPARLRIYLLVPAIGLFMTLFSQSNLSAEFVGLTIHPAGDEMADLQPNKLDPEARFVVNYGGVLTWEKFVLSDVLAVRGLQALLADCSAGWASVTQVAVKGMVIRHPRHRLGIALGPAFMVRQSWYRFESYSSSGFMKEGHSSFLGPVQYKFIPLAAELEYDYRVTPRWDLTFSLTPGLPVAITIAGGIKYWISRDFTEPVLLPKVK